MRIKALLIIAVLFSGCASVNHYYTDGQSDTLPPTNAESIKVFSTEKADKEYRVLGSVIAAADAGNNGKRPVKLLKMAAASMGADAIVNLKLKITQGYWASGVEASGTAVKFINN